MRRDDQRQAVKNIPLEQLKPFKNHPFQVRDDEEFRRLVESIEIHGVIHPAVARQIGEDCYELISGHRRKAACEVLGYSEMPVLVRSMTDDEAVVNMVDANLQRETILPSERAFAYKMKLVAMSHQGRKGFTSAQLGRKCVGKESRELIAEQVGQSRNQISRYIRLTELIPEILEMVDNRKMALNPAVSISYLYKKQQKLLYMLPLYYDEVCSADSRKMIEEHLQECEKCSNIFQKLKTECVVDTKENAESIQSSVMGKMAHSWKRSLLRSFIIGIVITTIVLTAIFGTYYALFIRQNSMVSPEQISISAYSLTDEQITFRLELLDGYCGGTIKTYTDENRNLYISVLRTVIKEELSDGETEIMNYGFNHEKKDYIAVYYGTPNNCELIWKKGDLLPTAPKDIFE